MLLFSGCSAGQSSNDGEGTKPSDAETHNGNEEANGPRTDVGISDKASEPQSDPGGRSDTEYELLLSQYYEHLVEYNESDYGQFAALDYEATEIYRTLLGYRESISEDYPYGHRLHYETPQTTIIYSEIFDSNGQNYRFVTYVPGFNNSRVFIQQWNNDIVSCSELIYVLRTATAGYDVVDTRVITDESGVYANILIRKSDYFIYSVADDSYEMHTYRVEGNMFTSYVSIDDSTTYGNWLIEECVPFLSTYPSAISIHYIGEKETGLSLTHRFVDNELVIFEVGNSNNSVQLVFDGGMWKVT